MPRANGTFNIYSNYDVSVKKPFDARMLVPTYDDLTDKSNWYLRDTETEELTNTFIAYNGMLVAVADKANVQSSGLYMLFDKDSTKNPNVEIESNWHKIGDNPSAEVDLSTIEATISEIKSKIDDIDQSIADLLQTSSNYATNDYIADLLNNEIATKAELTTLSTTVETLGSQVDTIASRLDSIGGGEVNVNSLVQTPGDVLILDGGNNIGVSQE